LGGVGSYAAEALTRCGVGHVTIVDFDRVCLTNVNRQIHATRATVGKPKAELMAERARAINPQADVRALPLFYSPETSEQILDRRYDYVFDCIDNMATKVHLIEQCVLRDLPLVAAMGAGGRLDPTRIQVSDISRTKRDPFARIVRGLLRDRGITQGVECVWSDEPPNVLDREAEEGFRCICPDRANSPHSCDQRFQVQGSVSWMPPMFGLAMAGTAVNRMLGRELAVDRVRDPKTGRTPPAGGPNRERRRQLMAAAGLVPLPSPDAVPS
jgi:tRNA A37 threonylcarbamoyladenosine dehydratase